MNLIGISGFAGSGKDILATLLSEQLPNSKKISIGECIRTELRSIGIEPNRELQRFVADHRRKTIGANYWIDQALAQMPPHVSTCILAGIYAGSEADHIQRLGGKVIWVSADESTRLKRIQARKDGARDALAQDDPQSFATIIRAEAGELHTSDNEVSLSQVESRADRVIENDGDLNELRATTTILAQDLIRTVIPITRNFLSLHTAKGTDFSASSPWTDDPDSLFALERTSFFSSLLGMRNMAKPNYEDLLAKGTSLKEVISVLYRPNLRSISGNQTAKRMAEVFEDVDPNRSLKRLRIIVPSNQEEEYFCELDDSQFFDMHLRSHVLWRNQVDEIKTQIPAKLKLFAEKDIEQFNGAVDRSLSRMRREGVPFAIAEDAIPQLQALATNPICAFRPILEIVKNERIFEVAGFARSKASLVIHDAIDHLWTFDLLDRIGILKKYAQMFNSIGNPEKTDLFRREGEAVASISFGVRAFAGVAPGFRSLMGTEDIVRMVHEMHSQLSDRHTDALTIVNNLASNGFEWRSLGYTYSNYITELDEQRKTYGSIKYRDPTTNRIEGRLDPGSADYLCFFIETHHALLQNANKHRNSLFCAHYILEEYLRNASATGNRPRIALTPSLLDGSKFTFDGIVPADVAEWMFRNYAFSANRLSV